MAAQNGHLEICQELMKDRRIDPSDNLNYAIRKASEHGHLLVVRVSYQHSFHILIPTGITQR